MPLSEWKEAKLKDLIDIKHGYAFKGEFITEEENEHVLLTPGNFNIGGGFKSNKFKYFNGKYPDDYILKPNDIIVTMTDLSKEGDTLGYSAKVPKIKGKKLLHNQRLGLLLFKDDKVSKDFIYWLMRTRHYQKTVLGSATGTTVKHTAPSRIQEYKFLLPPLPEQQSIAEILGSLDDKIELNRQMNKTLEEMAQAVFKSWFVDFDPVKAKAEGRAVEGLSQEILDLFPDSFVESELGDIPKGWTLKTLEDVSKNVSETYNLKAKDKVIFVNTGDVSEGKFLHKNYSDTKTLPGQAKKSIKPNDILFSEIRPANKRFAYVTFPSDDYVVSTKFMIIRANEEIMSNYLYTILKSQSTLDEFQIQAESRSGTFPQITFQSVGYFPIIHPSKEVLTAFDAFISSIYIKILQNYFEIETLSNIRDSLLPKLISGEIRVGDAEKIMEGAV